MALILYVGCKKDTAAILKNVAGKPGSQLYVSADPTLGINFLPQNGYTVYPCLWYGINTSRVGFWFRNQQGIKFLIRGGYTNFEKFSKSPCIRFYGMKLIFLLVYVITGGRHKWGWQPAQAAILAQKVKVKLDYKTNRKY